MKRSISLLLIICSSFILLPIVYANGEDEPPKTDNSESSGAAQTSSGYTVNCSGSSCKGIVTDSKTTGVRITFVDENGVGLTSSFDFINYYNGGSKNLTNFTIVKNTSGGDKSKMSGSFTRGTGKIKDIPYLSSLIKEYNSYTDSSGKGVTKSSLATSGNTGGGLAVGFEPEVAWFTGITDSNNSNYRVDVNGLIYAISKIYPEFSASNFIMEMEKGCQDGKNIFIQMEPMYLYWKSKSSEEGFGTVRDLVQIWPNEWKDYAKAKAYSFINYPNELQKVKFNGYTKFTPGYMITDDSQINDPIGYAVALDWANDANNYCNLCVFKEDEQQMYYHDELISTYQPPFSNVYEYTLSSESSGLDCCHSLDTLYSNNQLSDEWKEQYEFYCKEETHDPCTKVVGPTGETKYYCLDPSSECDEETFKEQCDPGCEIEPEEPEFPGDQCCANEPIEIGHIEGDVHNCCADGTTSEAHDYDLDELFCDNNTLGTKNTQYKCGTEFYIDEDADLEEDYCEMYCTERVSVEIPGTITAISGRYFKLNTTSHNTTSSYIEGYKRCRVRVKYDTWEQDYYDIVQTQVDAYNAFQVNKANELMYQAAIDASTQESESTNISQSCTTVTNSSFKQTKCSDHISGIDENKCYNVTQTQSGTASPVTTGKTVTACKNTDSKNTCYISKTTTTTSTSTSQCTVKYTKYPFKKMYDIYSVKIDEDKRDTCQNIYDAIDIIADKKTKTSHALDWTAWNIDTSDCTNKVNNQTGSSSTTNSTTTCTAGRTSQTEAEKRQENVPQIKDNFASAAQASNNAYNSSADSAKIMEDTIDKCDNYFSDEQYKGANAEESYKFNASQKFSYTQIYMDDRGELQLDEIYVNFEETPGCVIDPVVVEGPDEEDKLAEQQYSTNKYGTGSEIMHDFKNATLDYQSTKEGYTIYKDDAYEADKIFTHDAKYHATCSWDEGENTLYTLVPNGSATESTSEMNYTKHDQEYKVYLTTLEGTYETYWDISGLGTPRNGESEGRFDQFFKDAGNTCSNENPNASTMLTCKISSEHEIVLTGYCNGSNGSDTTTNPDDCDPYKEGYRLFNFKVVDAANLFPSGINTVDGNIAYNWINTAEGQDAMSRIESDASSGKTYSPDNLTYSFVLTPNDMGHIKNYNAEQVDDGGYSDFKLTCNCESPIVEGGDPVCQKCKSSFLENLSNGIVTYSGISHSVSGWGNVNRDLTAIRNGNGIN